MTNTSLNKFDLTADSYVLKISDFPQISLNNLFESLLELSLAGITATIFINLKLTLKLIIQKILD